MIKPFIAASLAFTLLMSTSTQKQIVLQSDKLKESKQQEKQLSQKLSVLSQQILKEQSVLEEIERDILSLVSVIASNKKELMLKKKELRELEESQKNLLKKKRGIEQDIINILAQELSFSLVVNQTEMAYTEDLINEEVFISLSTITRKNISDLKKIHTQLSEDITLAEESIKNFKQYIAESEEKKRKLTLLERKKQNAIKELGSKKSVYKKRLAKIVEEQKSLDAILVKLKIKQKEEIKQAELRREQEEQARLARQEAAKRNTTTAKTAPPPTTENDDVDVRQIGSSYTKVKTTRYKGRKTIPPLESFDVVKKFGPYYDPVYKIKVFNESITLKSKSSDAKVKNVMDGKVVFAKETPMLDNVVIVEHPGEMHTIYAHLDKIAPTVKQGRKIKKGYTIGRVRDSLMFEVTKKSYHIDPLDVIAMR